MENDIKGSLHTFFLIDMGPQVWANLQDRDQNPYKGNCSVFAKLISTHMQQVGQVLQTSNEQ